MVLEFPVTACSTGDNALMQWWDNGGHHQVVMRMTIQTSSPHRFPHHPSHFHHRFSQVTVHSVHSFAKKYCWYSQTNTVDCCWQIQFKEREILAHVFLPSWLEVFHFVFCWTGKFSGDDHWFTRSKTPTSTSPRTWRGSLPSWRSWTTPSSSPCRRSSLSATSTGCSLTSTLDGGEEGGELRAAGGDEQVVVQLWSSFLWRDLNEDDRDDEGSFWAEIQKWKNNVCSGGRLCSLILARSSSSPLSPSWGLQCSRFLSNPVTMMGMLDYNSHNDGEIVDDDDDNALISLRWFQCQKNTVCRLPREMIDLFIKVSDEQYCFHRILLQGSDFLCCSDSSLLLQVMMIMRGWWMMMSVLCVFVCQCFCVWECFVL